MNPRAPALALGLLLALLTIPISTSSASDREMVFTSCFGPSPIKSANFLVSISPTKTATISMDLYASTLATTRDKAEDKADEGRCEASVSVPLSAYPSARLASRPASFAPAIRELVREWGAKQCQITVWFENDSNDELSPGETCVQESFGFSTRRHWTKESEHPCFEGPDA